MSDVSQFNGAVVWITGASSGIGEALALAFAKEDARLVLSARNQDTLEAVKTKCDQLSGKPENSVVVPLDVTKSSQIESALKDVMAHFGRVDVLINNAGISQRSRCLDTEMATYRTIFDVDVFGQIELTKAVLPVMIEQGQGHIAVTASVAGKIGAPFRTGYSAAKHAMMGFFDALRTEVHDQNIRVTTIVPGYIQTNISANAVVGDGSKFGQLDTDIRGGMSVTDCADKILHGMRNGTLEITVGKGMEMHALWLKRFFPNLLFKLANRQYQKAARRGGFKL